MAAIEITKGKDWSVIRPVYQQKSNYSLWRLVRTQGNILQYWEEYEQWKATGGDTEDAFIESIFAKCAPAKDMLIDLSGATITYKILNGGGGVVARPTVYSLLPDVDSEDIDLFAISRIGLYLSQAEVDAIPLGTYFGVITLTNGTASISADAPDTITFRSY